MFIFFSSICFINLTKYKFQPNTVFCHFWNNNSSYGTILGADGGIGVRFADNSALNINGDSDGSRPKIAMNTQGTAFNADHSQGGFTVSSLESPGTTSTITYKAQVLCQAAANPFIMNGVPNNGNTGNIYHSRGSSSITAWEIAQ